MSISGCMIYLLKSVLSAGEWVKANLRHDVEVGPHTRIRNAMIASNVRIGTYCNIQRLEVGTFSYIGDYSQLQQTKIGKFTSIASHVKLAAGNHPMNYVSTSPYTYSPIKHSFAKEQLFDKEFFYTDDSKRYLCEIGNDVWIGTGATLVCGSKALNIGDGAVIAAGSVVTKDVPPYAVVAGCPAKILRYRFSDETISEMEKEKWWDKDEDWIRGSVQKFSDPSRLFAREDG